MTYAVIDTFTLSCGVYEYNAILCREANADLLAVPGVEPIACFVPIPGRGSYTQDLVRPSVLFWKGEFWIPLWIMKPKRENIAKNVYGDHILDDHTFDVLHRVEVNNIPNVDLLKIKDPELDTL